MQRYAQVQVLLAPLPIQSCVGAIANRGQWEQGCSLFLATDLGPVREHIKKKKKKKTNAKTGSEQQTCPVFRSWQLGCYSDDIWITHMIKPAI